MNIDPNEEFNIEDFEELIKLIVVTVAIGTIFVLTVIVIFHFFGIG